MLQRLVARRRPSLDRVALGVDVAALYAAGGRRRAAADARVVRAGRERRGRSRRRAPRAARVETRRAAHSSGRPRLDPDCALGYWGQAVSGLPSARRAADDGDARGGRRSPHAAPRRSRRGRRSSAGSSNRSRRCSHRRRLRRSAHASTRTRRGCASSRRRTRTSMRSRSCTHARCCCGRPCPGDAARTRARQALETAFRESSPRLQAPPWRCWKLAKARHSPAIGDTRRRRARARPAAGATPSRAARARRGRRLGTGRARG